MGFIRNKMKEVFEHVPLKFHDTSSDEEALPYVIFMDCTATDASSFSFELDEDVRVIDALCVAAGGNTSATAQVTDSDDNAITDAMDIAAAKTTARAGEIDDANWEESAGNSLKVAQNANGDNCYAYITVLPTG
jgi:hypothetical protein